MGMLCRHDTNSSFIGVLVVVVVLEIADNMRKIRAVNSRLSHSLKLVHLIKYRPLLSIKKMDWLLILLISPRLDDIAME